MAKTLQQEACGVNYGILKIVLATDGKPNDAKQMLCQRIDSAMVKTIARAFRWRDLLEKSTFSTVKEIADAESINASYLARVLRLTLLAPDIVESIVEGKQPTNITLAMLMRRFPFIWQSQKVRDIP